MKITSRIAVLSVSGCAFLQAVGALKVEERDGGFAVVRDGRPVIAEVRIECNESDRPDIFAAAKTSFAALADGSKVWNRWNETRDGRYRFEVVERADGAVEMSLVGQIDPYDKKRTRLLHLLVPDACFGGRKWEGLSEDRTKWQPLGGVFGKDFGKRKLRWLSTDGIIFDFNPLGAANANGIFSRGVVKGSWRVERLGSDWQLTGGSCVDYRGGGFIGTKIVIREGAFADYGKYHLMARHRYSEPLAASHRLSFGSNRHGECFADGERPFSEEVGYGWLAGAASREVVTGAPEGALYAAVSGSGKGTYRISGLADGFYLITVSSGNYTGVENNFSVSVNGDGLVRDASILSRTARSFSKAVHVSGGCADIEFTGRYLLSVIGVQPLMGDGEDFSVNRGFWMTVGYEPGSIYRSEEAARRPVFPAADETYELPVPGTETAAERRDVPMPIELPDPNLETLQWLRTGKTVPLFTTLSTLAELDDPETRRKFIGEMTDGKGCSAVMLSGLHFRHAYENRIDAGIEAIRRIAEEVHARGLKLIDHHDATLLSNVNVGLRVLMESVPEMVRSRPDGLPSMQFCPCNRRFSETYYAYLRSLVEAGVDGFQIDEVEFWEHGCVCAACRERFHRETGWMVPANECDKAFNDPKSLLRKRWHEWRVKTVTNWFVELRRRVKDIKPDLVLNMYTTHWGFLASMPGRGGSNDLIDLGRTVNFFGTEVMTRNVMASARALPPLRKAKNLLKIAYGTPVWAMFYSNNCPCDYFAWCLGNMHGQIPLLFGYTPVAGDPPYEVFGGSEVNMNLDGAEPIAAAALLFSAYSRDWNRRRSNIGELFGTAQELEALHVPYEIIGDRTLEEGRLGKYRFLFVGASHCLSEREILEIESFAKGGGTVYLSGLAGTCDEIGEARAAWPFRGIVGSDPTVVNGDGVVVDRPCGKGRMIYCTGLRGEPFSCNELCPGKGRVCTFDPDRNRERTFRAELEKLFGSVRVWSVDAPERVYTTLWKEKDGAIVVHFLNATGVREHPGELLDNKAPDPAFPDLEKDVVFSIEAPAAKSVTAASPDFFGVRDLRFSRSDSGVLTVTLPKELLKVYALVRISKK